MKLLHITEAWMKGSLKQQDYWIDPEKIVSITYDTYQLIPNHPAKVNNGAMQITFTNRDVLYCPASYEGVVEFVWLLQNDD